MLHFICGIIQYIAYANLPLLSTNERIGWTVARIAACWRVLNEFDGDGVHSGQSRQHKRYHEGIKLSETLPFNEAE